MDTENLNKKVRLIFKIGSALHKYGTNAYRLENCLKSVSDYLNIQGHFFSTPTYLAISIDYKDEQINRHIRVLPGETNLAKLQEVDSLANDVCNGKISVDEAILKLEDIDSSPAVYPSWLMISSFSITSLALAVLLKGGVNEVILSGIFGAFLGIVAHLKTFSHKLNEVFEFLVSFLIMFSIYALQNLGYIYNYQIVLISALIVIIPGLALTIAMTELATKHLVSGTARLMGALVELFKLSFGILLGVECGKLFFPPIISYGAEELNLIYFFIAVAVAAFAFTIIFQAKLKDFFWILLSGFLTIGPLFITSLFFNQILSVFIASSVIGIASNLFARLRDRPAAIMLLPGIIFLVPGSIGLKGINLMIQNELLQGMTGGVQMFVISMSIVSGLFLGNLLVNPRKNL